MTEKTYAEALADKLPVCDDGESDFISLCDIVITGIETPFNHFGVLTYKPNGDGVAQPWATITALPGAMPSKKNIEKLDLTVEVMRKAVHEYLQDRLDRGMDLLEAAKMVDGSYTDALVADSILQFALYGEEVFG